MSEEEWKVINCMKKYGGSFVQQLAKLYQVADGDNRLKIRTSFSRYWINYWKISSSHASSALESKIPN